MFEGLVGDQTDILREHGEEAAHEEFGDVLRVVAAAFQCSGNLCQTRRDVARDLSRFQHRVEALRVKRDAEGLAIREMRVVFPQAGEIREHLDDVTGIGDQQEGRVAVIDGKGIGQKRELLIIGCFAVALGRLLGFEHEAMALVAIDAARRCRAIGMLEGDIAFEDAIVPRGIVLGHIGLREAKRMTESGDEELVVRQFRAARGLGLGDEGLK